MCPRPVDTRDIAAAAHGLRLLWDSLIGHLLLIGYEGRNSPRTLATRNRQAATARTHAATRSQVPAAHGLCEEGGRRASTPAAKSGGTSARARCCFQDSKTSSALITITPPGPPGPRAASRAPGPAVISPSRRARPRSGRPPPATG